MSKKISVSFLVVLALAVFTSAVIVSADTGVLAQNANSSTTQDDQMQTTENAAPAPRRGRRRGRRRAAAPAAAMPSDVATDMGAQSPGEQTDLSGTYTGNIAIAGGHEMSGEGTLTITSNQFTLESNGMTHAGRIYAVTTRGYTGVSLYFNDITDSATNTPIVAMGRAKKNGDRLWITPVPGARTTVKLTPAGGGGGGGHRRAHRTHRGRRAAPATPETPSETPAPPSE